jgi:hypothetical protein
MHVAHPICFPWHSRTLHVWNNPAGAAADDISVVDESTLKELSAKSGCNDAWTLDKPSIWQVGL